MTAPDAAPETSRVFISYSHDSDWHKSWVLGLATRLMADGVNVILDQWDLRWGTDLPLFMENGLIGADRVIAVCTEPYVKKANAGQGGVVYERLILTGDLMTNIASERIIPITREVAKRLFPWARIQIDDEFYDLYGPEESDEDRLRRAQDADNGIEDVELTPDDIRPYNEAASAVDSYRLELKLNEVGKAYLLLMDYLQIPDDTWTGNDDDDAKDDGVDLSVSDEDPSLYSGFDLIDATSLEARRFPLPAQNSKDVAHARATPSSAPHS